MSQGVVRELAGELEEMWSLDVAARSHRGRVRECNEDQFLVGTTKRSLEIDRSSIAGPDGREVLLGGAEGTLLIVADGMGGAGGGDVASAVAIESMAQAVCAAIPLMAQRRVVSAPERAALAAARRKRERRRRLRAVEDADTVFGIRSRLADAVAEAHDKVVDAAQHDGAHPGMGTTLTAAYLTAPWLYYAHVGDSRCYLLGSETRDLTQITTDHTVAAQLAAAGNPVAPSSRFHDVLWNAVGGTSALAEADVARLTLLPGDALLLCSDGLTKHVSDDEIRDVLASDCHAASCCEALIERALEGGGTDNVTVIVAFVHEP